jgi:Kae1-associated kinase Bud32
VILLEKFFYKGAEAELSSGEYLGIPCVIKKRVPKAYRIPELDRKLRYSRMRTEVSLLRGARKAVNTPHVLGVDTKGSAITMEKVQGEKVKDLFLRGKRVERTAKEIGKAVALLHRDGIIHNDLTTSNMIAARDGIYFVDFGMGFRSQKLEDKATDLVVFRKMLKSTHYALFGRIWAAFIAGYAEKGASGALARAGEAERRARYQKRTESNLNG